MDPPTPALDDMPGAPPSASSPQRTTDLDAEEAAEEAPSEEVEVTQGPAMLPPAGETETVAQQTESFAQEQVSGAVVLSGTLSCDSCAGPLLVWTEDPTTTPPTLVARKSFPGPGPYQMMVPTDTRLVVMVIDDSNGDLHPTPGESIGLWEGGIVSTSSRTTNIDLVVGIIPDQPPVAGPGEAVEG